MEFATGALGTLLPKLGELLLDEYNLQKGLKEGIKDLMDKLLVIQAALVRVSDVPLDHLDPQVKIWANDVRELSFAIEDSLDSFMVRVEGLEPTKPHTFFGFIKKASKKVTKLKIRREIANDIKDVKIQVKEVKERYDRYKDVIGNTNARTVDPRLLAMYNKVSDLVGIDKAMDELTERLLSDGDGPSSGKLKVVSVVGFGGLGKTTLAKAVYDKLNNNFDCGVFVPVGQNPNMKKVLRDILLELDRELYKASATMDERQLINQLQTFLVGKRYFLIFDDIWDIQTWEIIRCTLVESNIGSIVITTTRIYDVALNAGDVYKLEPLFHDNSEELFYKRLFGGKVELPDEQTQLIQKLLQKCGGVPLAIITIANLLSSAPKEDWHKVYNSIVSGAANENDVENMRNILLLSYYDLPIYLRACLLHLSIFPEDYMVRKDALIWMWVAEGFIRDESGVGLFEIGERYFNKLINRSLIQPVKISHGGVIIGCRVHDMILDMICSIAQEGSFVTILNSNEQQHTSMEFKARRLALHKEFVGDQCLQAYTGMSQVRSFNAFMCHTAMIPPLVSFQVLRVLAIEDCSFQTEGGAYSLEHIGKLLHLRYLGLQKTSVRELPKEVGKLKYLEVLDLRQTGIPELPDSVSLLRRLKCLRADGGSTEVPDWIGTLTSVEELSLNDISSCPNFVKEVSKLTELRDLKVWIRWLDERSKKALVKSLGNLQKIQVLHLDGGLWIEDDEWEGYVPPRQLRCLSLRTKSSRLPRWIKDSFLPNLSHLSVGVRVVEAEDLKILGSFPELTTLELFVPNSVSLLFEGHPCSAFPKLRHCYTSGMLRFLQGAAPQLESVHFNVSLSALNGTTFQCGFLGNLPLLMEVRVEIFHSDVEVYHAEEVEEALRLAVKVHGNCPTLHVSKFELSFNEDAEKEEDDIELEEEDEEDWYSPTAKAI